MNVPEESFLSYLRNEVDIAGLHYECAAEKVFAVLGGPNPQPGPDLMVATRELSEDLRLYAGAIRRMANYASHQLSPRQKHLTAHA